MDGSRGLSKSEREDLLMRIDRLLGDSPKGQLVRQIVEGLPGDDDEEPPGRPGADQSGKTP